VKRTLSAMSSSEVPSTCADNNTSYENSLTAFSSLTRSKSQLLNQPQNATRKRRANIARINLANMSGQQRASGAQGLTGVFGSQDSLNSANGISDDDSNCDSPLDDANEKRLRLNSQSSSQYSSDDGYEQIAELECSQGSASARSHPTTNGSITTIGNGTYEIVGGGRDVKAVHRDTNAIMQCQILKPEEFKIFVMVNERIKHAESMYHQSEFRQLKELIIPEGTVSIKGENGLWYILMPDHQGSLHSYVQSRKAVFTERQAQPIFKQIVELVEFCHQISIYLRDFKLRKFVFVDEKKYKIRLNSVLDLFVAPNLGEDAMSDRCVCPAYVAPEILDMKQKTYAAKTADVWGLGVLMFILLTGHYPFFDSNPRAFFRRIKARRFSYPLSDSISHPARWLLYSLLRQNPCDRPSATELLHSLWLRTDPESLPDDEKTTRVLSSSQPTNSSIQNSQTLTSSSSQPSLATIVTPMTRIFLATPISAETSLGTRVLPTPDLVTDIDQTVPSMVPMSAPVVAKDTAGESLRVESNVFLANIMFSASVSDSQAHLSSHI